MPLDKKSWALVVDISSIVGWGGIGRGEISPLKEALVISISILLLCKVEM